MARPAVFTSIVLGVTGVCGLAVVAYFAYLLVSHPAGFLLGLLVALLPLAGLLAYFWWLDSRSPQPRELLLLGVLWGALAATGAALVINTLAELAIGDIAAVIEAPWMEEGMKGLFLLLLLLLRRDRLTGPLSGLVYAGCVAAGFAFVENVTYFAVGYDGDGVPGDQQLHGIGGLLLELLVRGLLTPFAHPLFTSMTGLGVALSATTRSRALRWLAPPAGYLCAVLLHGGWNGILELGPLFAVPIFLLVYGPAWSTYLTVGILLRLRPALSPSAPR